jgi:hypothetical protein
MAVEHISKGNDDGTTFGQSTSDPISFYGVTPISQPTASAQTAITDSSGGTANPATGVAALTATYNSTLIANALATIVAQTNAYRTALVNLGLIKGS